MKFLGSLSLSLLAFSATSWVAASSSPDSVSLHYRAQALDEPTGLHMRKLRRSNLHPRQQNIVDEAATNPVQAANDAAALPGVAGNTNGNDLAAGDLVQGDSDEGQLPWNSAVPFVANANAAGDPTNGWQALPQMDGFTLNRSLVITEGAIQPFYISGNYTAANIKRAVIVWPGKPRDSWKYTNLIRNALSVVVANASSGITADQVLIIGPAWMNDNDKTAGAVQGNELYFHGTQWQSGGNSRGPNLTHVVSTYEVMDTFTDMLFDKAQFPNLNQVVIAGHSMGGQATQRYALLKKTKSYDNNMRYWLGNPGSWAWLVSDRPVANASCAGFDDWHYGIGNATSVTKYARKDVEASKQAVIDRFRSRNVHYALGLLDNGAGDTHCQAEMQGANHLDRGSKFIQMLGAMPGGFPSAHTADFIANTSHQDYAMISANVSLQRIFIDGFNDRLPDVTNTTNPGDKTNSNKTGISTTSQKAQKSFATPIHKKISYALLIGSIAGVAIAFAIMPWIFPASNDAWEQDQWEVESKRKLL